MIRKKIALFSLFLPLVLSASDVSEYVGLGVGSSAYVDNGFAKRELASVSEDIALESIGAKIYGGVRFNKIIGIEATYIYYGHFKLNDNYSYKAHSISVAANLGYTFLGTQLRPFALVGLGYVISDFNDEGLGIDKKKPTLEVGFGLDYMPHYLSGFGVRIAFESNNFSYSVEGSDTEGVKYDQGIGIGYIGVSYHF